MGDNDSKTEVVAPEVGIEPEAARTAHIPGYIEVGTTAKNAGWAIILDNFLSTIIGLIWIFEFIIPNASRPFINIATHVLQPIRTSACRKILDGQQ